MWHNFPLIHAVKVLFMVLSHGHRCQHHMGVPLAVSMARFFHWHVMESADRCISSAWTLLAPCRSAIVRTPVIFGFHGLCYRRCMWDPIQKSPVEFGQGYFSLCSCCMDWKRGQSCITKGDGLRCCPCDRRVIGSNPAISLLAPRAKPLTSFAFGFDWGTVLNCVALDESVC